MIHGVRKNVRTILTAFVLFFTAGAISFVFAQGDPATDYVCAGYLTGIGCHNCAVADPALFTHATFRSPNLVIMEYEIYHAQEANFKIKEQYFKNYWKADNAGVPYLILNQNQQAMGKMKVLELAESLSTVAANPCPLPDGTSVRLEDLDLTQLKGKVNIWTRDRILMTEKAGGNDAALKKILGAKDVRSALRGLRHEKIDAKPVEISGGEIAFKNAVKIGDWTVQWNDHQSKVSRQLKNILRGIFNWIFILAIAGLLVWAAVKIERGPDGKIRISLRQIDKKRNDYIAVVVAGALLIIFFLVAHRLPSDFIEKAGVAMSLPLFTMCIGLVDSVNPCNMFVLTCLMAFLISVSHSRFRLYVVGYTFVVVVFAMYFLFMAAWLNIFKYVSLITPLRIGLGLLALGAGIINCKELLFFKKGVSLTIPEAQRGPLMKKIYAMKTVIQKGTWPVLIFSSISLAVLSSLVEIPCTAGFPIIYTAILSAKVLKPSIAYYGYLFLYNVIYVIPLMVIISMFVYTFRGAPISQRQMEIIKFVGGIIMLVLGIVLLVNPALVGISVK